MSIIDDILRGYSRFVQIAWDQSVAGPQRVWMVVYPPEQERRMRMRLGDFRTVTLEAGHAWRQVDLTDAFGLWLADHEYRDAYFANPEAMAPESPALDEFAEYLADMVRGALLAEDADEMTVVALTGLGSLFGLTRASRLFDSVNAAIKGRLLAFFPGEHEGTNYRLLGAQDGWSYLASPIKAVEE